MPISDSIFQCDDRTTVGHFGKNSRLCQILNGRFQVISFQKFCIFDRSYQIMAWSNLSFCRTLAMYTPPDCDSNSLHAVLNQYAGWF